MVVGSSGASLFRGSRPRVQSRSVYSQPGRARVSGRFTPDALRAVRGGRLPVGHHSGVVDLLTRIPYFAGARVSLSLQIIHTASRGEVDGISWSRPVAANTPPHSAQVGHALNAQVEREAVVVKRSPRVGGGPESVVSRDLGITHALGAESRPGVEEFSLSRDRAVATRHLGAESVPLRDVVDPERPGGEAWVKVQQQIATGHYRAIRTPPRAVLR